MAKKLDFGQLVSWGFKNDVDLNFLVRLILWTAVLWLGVYLIIGTRYIATYGDFLIANYELQLDPNDPVAASALFREMGRLFWPMVFLNIATWLIIASAETAFHKRIFFKEDKGFFPLRFGTSELKLMCTHFLFMLSVLGTYITALIAVMFLVTLGVAISGFSKFLGAILGGIFVFAGIIGLIALVLHIIARLAPAGAMTIKRNQIAISDSWRKTKGNVTPILFAMLVAILLGYVAITIIQIGIISAAFGSDSGLISVVMSSTSHNPVDVFENIKNQMTETRTFVTLIVGLMAATVFFPIWYIVMWGIGNRAALDLE